MTIKKLDLKKAHKHSSFHRTEVEKSKVCGCFYCLGTFKPTEIKTWLKETRAEKASGEKKEDTALCPLCEIDSVIGYASGLPVDDKDFLNDMYEHFFSTSTYKSFSDGDR